MKQGRRDVHGKQVVEKKPPRIDPPPAKGRTLADMTPEERARILALYAKPLLTNRSKPT